MRSDPDKKTLDLEEVGFLQQPGFCAVAMSLNNDLGKVVVVRKCDDKSVERPVFRIEFYNVVNMPAMFLESRHHLMDVHVECAVWLGKSVLLGCNDGAVVLVSPFGTGQQRLPVSATPIVASASMSGSQAVVASESGELFFLETDQQTQLQVVRKTVLNSDQRVISLAMSPKLPILAVGLMNGVLFLNIETDKRNVVHVQAHGHKNTIVWALLFVDDLLFSGDSRGKVTIYNPSNLAVIKIITTHESDVMSLCTDGENVFASGVDHRIQVLKGTSSQNARSDWNTVGQRIIHSNDVTCMVSAGDWLISAGAQHEILISNRKFLTYYPKEEVKCQFDKQKRFMVFRSLQSIELWERPRSLKGAQAWGNVFTFPEQSDVGPKKLLKYVAAKNAVIFDMCFAPDGKHLAVLCEHGLLVYALKLTRSGAKLERIVRLDSSEANGISALASSNDCLFIAKGNSEIVRLAYNKVNRERLASRDGGARICKLVSTSDGKFLAGTTTRCELFFVNVKSDADLDCPESVSALAFVEGRVCSLLALTPGPEAKLRIYQPSKETRRRVVPLIGVFEQVPYEVPQDMSDHVGDSVLVGGSHGNVLVLAQFSKPDLLLTFANPSSQAEESAETEAELAEKRKKQLCRPVDQEVHWGSALETGRQRSLILCRPRPQAPPTRAPFRIRRYGRL